MDETENFLVSPEDCLILKAFKDSKSLREAASLLKADPAGLTRKVQHISNQYGFLQKVNNRWQVTARGMDMVAWVEASILSQRKTLLAKSTLRLASTTWFSEEMLIPNLQGLKNELAENMGVSLSVPRKEFELSLIDGSVDFVIVCHPPENPEVEHRVIGLEKWVLIAPKSWKSWIQSHEDNILESLQKKPLVRHSDINIDLFLPDLQQQAESEFQIGNLIGIRSAVTQGLGWSLVPRILVERHLKDQRLIEVPFEVPVKDRKICLWWLRNRHDSKRLSNKVAQWLKEAL